MVLSFLASAMEITALDYTDFLKHTLSETSYSEAALSEKIDQKLRDETVSQEWMTDQYLVATYLGYTNICNTLATLSNEAHQPLLVVQHVVAEPKKNKQVTNETLRGTPYALDVMSAALNAKTLQGTLTQAWVTDKYVAAIYLGYKTVSDAFKQLRYKEHALHPAIQEIVDIKQKEKQLRASLEKLALYVMGANDTEIDEIESPVQATRNVKIVLRLTITAAVGEEFHMIVPIIDSYGNAWNITGIWTKASLTPQIADAKRAWTLTFQDLNASGIVGAPYDTTTGGLVVEFDAKGLPAGYYANGTTPVFPAANTPPTLNITGWAKGAEDSAITLDLGTVGERDGISICGDYFQLTLIKHDGYGHYEEECKIAQKEKCVVGQIKTEKTEWSMTTEQRARLERKLQKLNQTYAMFRIYGLIPTEFS